MHSRLFYSAMKLIVVMVIGGVFAWSRTSTPAAPQQAADETRTEAALQQARQMAGELAEKLRGLLSKELQEGGYAGAVKVCSEVGQEIPREFTARMGHYIRRVSLGYRNPKDVPDNYEQQKLEEFDRLNREKKLGADYSEVVKEEEREYLRYMKPLVAAPMCITCHGQKENIPPEVRAVLTEKYPDDRATGYHAGDVRGAISVKIALSPDESRK